MSNTENNFLLKEAAAQARKEKIIYFAKTYKKSLIALVIISLMLIFGSIAYNFHKNNEQRKYSSMLHDALISEDEKEMISKIAKIYQEEKVTRGVKALTSLRYAANLAQNGQTEDAVKAYMAINKSGKYDKYIAELSGLYALKILIDQNDKKYDSRIFELLAELKIKSKLLKYFILEQEAIFKWQKGDFQDAAIIFQNLSANPEASETLKKRSLEMHKIYVSRFGAINRKSNDKKEKE